MKKTIISFLVFFFFYALSAQTYNVDSLKKLVATTRDDSSRLENLFQIVIFYIDNNLDSSLKYVKLFNQIPAKPGEWQANGLTIMGDIYLRLGNPSKSLETLLKALQLEGKLNNPFVISMIYWNIGKVYQNQNDYDKAINYYSKSLKISSSSSEPIMQGAKSKALAYLGLVYFNLNKIDSALYYSQSSYNIIKQIDNKTDLALIYVQLGNIYQKLGNASLSLHYYRMASKEAIPLGNFSALSGVYIDIAELLEKNKQPDSSYYYARQGFIIAEELNNVSLVVKASTFLKSFFKDKNKLDSAFKYQEIETTAKDGMLSLEKIKKVQSISFEEQQRLQESEVQKKEYQNKIKLYGLIISLIVFLFIAIFLYRNNRRKQKTNMLLQQQKEKIQNTLTQLKSTQAQLIQSEKMASLGELTAGIAHEIQNPLNFVNNFSEVNNELIEELKAELETGNQEQALEVINDIQENSTKINQHGKRADAIVKGMLQHSKQTKGIKEPIDINALCDEYLRLSYHGMRAKDKNFNADFKTDFDERIGKINIVSQDIGRMLLNLFNNAFYAVNEKKKSYELSAMSYEPLVSVQTKKLNDKIEIRIEDNGNGIPSNIIDKIFQPFFTTKPTGQGTGLGLSLAYDIITKEHNGTIKVESKEGEGSKFIIQLPI